MNTISIKLKFRPSTKPEKKGSLYFQLIHERKVRKLVTKHKIYKSEWDNTDNKIILPPASSPRYVIVNNILLDIKKESEQLMKIMLELSKFENGWSRNEVIKKLKALNNTNPSVFKFIEEQSQNKKKTGKIRSFETYQATLKSFKKFRKGIDLSFDMIDSELMELYEAELRSRGLSRNTTSFYMRILRTNYKIAIEKNLTKDKNPFKRVYCGMDKTVKRSITLAEIKKIKELDLTNKPILDFARDMFIFSFCTRGMSFIDMAYLKKKDLVNGYLTYRRKKTGQLLIIEWTKHMQDIIDKYKPNATQYLLPIIICEDGSERRQYLNQITRINRRLKKIASLANLSVPLSLYYSRHSWATIARRKDIPISIISEGLGHDSEITTQIYLDSIRSTEVDKANRDILKDL